MTPERRGRAAPAPGPLRADLLAFLEEQPVVDVGARGALAPPLQHAVIGDVAVPFGTHLCALYASDGGRASQAAAFLADGLRPSVVCFLVAAPVARRQIVAQVERGGPSIQSHIDAGRLVLCEYAGSVRDQLELFETVLVGATRAGAQALLVVGDVSGGLARRIPFHQLIGEYESRYDQSVARRFPVVTLCQYDVRRLSGRELFDVLRSHEHSLRYLVEYLLA